MAALLVVAAPPSAAQGGAKIVGGGPVDDVWPEIVFIVVDDAGGCTGTLIDPEWVLTAAHCIGESSALVYGGSNALSTLSWEIEASAGIAHPAYDPASSKYDYGLYQLSEPAPVVPNVDLADYDDTDLWAVDAELNIIGYGLTDGLTETDSLLGATLNVQLDESCVAPAEALGGFYDAATMLCLYAPGVSGCMGDSGGPIFGIDDDGRMRIVAVTSWGPADCSDRTYGAWIPGGLSWITSVLAGTSAPTEDEVGGVFRLFGEDRYSTATAVASAWTTADTVFIATGENFPDSLAAGPAAAKTESPILLVTRNAVPFSTGNELARLQPSRIVVVGGSAAISDAVLAELEGYTSGPVTRLAGNTRIETALAIVSSAFPDTVDEVWLAPSTSFPDPLLAGAAAAVGGQPLLLTEPGAPLDASVRDKIEALAPSRIVVMGDSAFASDPLLASVRELAAVDVIPGSSVYERGANLWGDFAPGTEYVVLSTGENFPDALVGATYAALAPASPLMLTERDCIPDAVQAELDRIDPQTIVLLGGPAALGSGAEALTSC